MATSYRMMTKQEIDVLKRKGARWLCVAAYDHDGLQKNDIISWHKTYDGAAKKAGPSQFKTVVDVNYIDPVD